MFIEYKHKFDSTSARERGCHARQHHDNSCPAHAPSRMHLWWSAQPPSTTLEPALSPSSTRPQTLTSAHPKGWNKTPIITARWRPSSVVDDESGLRAAAMLQQCCSSTTLQQCSANTAAALLLCAVLAVALRTSTAANVRLKATRSRVRDAAGAARLLLQRRRGSGCTALFCTAMPGALLPVLRPGHPKGCEPGCSLLLLGNVAHWRGRARGDAHSVALRIAARRGTARRGAARRGVG